MITLKSCPLCNSNRIIQYHESGIAPIVIHEIMPGVTVEAAVLSRYSLCQGCNVIFQNPRLSDPDLDKFYSQGFYRKAINSTERGINLTELKRARLDAKIIEQIIGKPASHLDIGCGTGYLLDEIGASVKVGIESNIEYSRAKGIEVYTEMDQVAQKSFHLVTAIHVLEHVPNPVGYLKSMTKFLSKDGFIVIEVPTWKSAYAPLRLAHLYHFEPDVFRLICKQVGLKVIHTEFTPDLLLICKLDH